VEKLDALWFPEERPRERFVGRASYVDCGLFKAQASFEKLVSTINGLLKLA
jgi:hypothetical protein